MTNRHMPGTTLKYEYSAGTNIFESIASLCRVSGGLSLSQVAGITGLEPTTIQNWIKRGWVSRTKGKKYSEQQLARIIIINSLRESLPLERIAEIMEAVNGEVNDLSDDIIDEGELYNRLCSVVICSDDRYLSPLEIKASVKRELSDYRGPTPDSKECLAHALEIMALAYEASLLKGLARRELDGWLG